MKVQARLQHEIRIESLISLLFCLLLDINVDRRLASFLPDLVHDAVVMTEDYLYGSTDRQFLRITELKNHILLTYFPI